MTTDTDRQKEIKTDRKVKQIKIQNERDRDTETWRDTHRDAQRERETKRQRQTDRQTDRKTKTVHTSTWSVCSGTRSSPGRPSS